MQAEDVRVAGIAYRLSVANVDLCDETAPQFGMVLQTASEYSPRLRAAVRRVFHIDDRPAVFALSPGGPAERAGLQAGDVILAVGGQATTSGGAPASDDGRPASYADVARAVSALQSAAWRGPVQISVARGTARLDLQLIAATGCAYDTKLVTSSAVKASADGAHVFVTSGLVQYAASQDDLASVLAHELAHDLLHHRARLDRANPFHRLVGDMGRARRR